jgi:hypothetical protein
MQTITGTREASRIGVTLRGSRMLSLEHSLVIKNTDYSHHAKELAKVELMG